MNPLVQLTMGGWPMTIFLFLVCGLISYLIDLRTFKEKPEYTREKKVTKFMSFTYIIGSLLAFAALQIVNLMI